MFQYKINILKALKAKGYNTTIIRRNNLIGESALSQIRQDKVVGIHTLDKICNMLECDISDIIEHIPD